jgi:uncharacterized protein (DUF952 family)
MSEHRWLYHALPTEQWRAAQTRGELRPASLATEGFVHTSYRDTVVESARLYLPKGPTTVLLVDPRRLGVAVDVATTPRGPMPHVMGPIPIAAVARVFTLEELEAEIAAGAAPDAL